MRLLVHGQQAFGKAVLESLLNRGENIVAVYGPEDAKSGVDPLIAEAHERNLPVYQPKSFRNNNSVAEECKKLKADLCVMAFVTKFVPSSFLNIPTHGTIQYHPSLLPLHRGPSSINWPIIKGSTETGLSIFWPDDGLDTGPILLQKKVQIEPEDTLGSIYFEKLFPMGVDAILEAVDLVRAGNAPKVQQDHSSMTYESWCRSKDSEIFWSRSIEDVHNLIRGCNPSPGAWSTINGQVIQIFDCRRDDLIKGKPGVVTAIREGCFGVACASGGIWVKRLRLQGRGKILSSEFVSTQNLSVGDVFGS